MLKRTGEGGTSDFIRLVDNQNKEKLNITYQGSVSGSIESTGSFGTLALQDNVTINSQLISGSTTGSFHRLHVEETASLQHVQFLGAVEFSGSKIRLGDSQNDIVVITASLSSSLVPHETNIYDLGTVTKRWRDLFISNDITGSITSTASLGHVAIDKTITGSITSTASLGHVFVDNTITGSLTSTASFGHLFVDGNISASGIVRADAFESRTGGESIDFRDSINVTGNLTASGDLSLDDIVATGNVSASITSTGSFGRVETAGDINTEGRIFEQGTSVVDHATAMAIVFGG